MEAQDDAFGGQQQLFQVAPQIRNGGSLEDIPNELHRGGGEDDDDAHGMF